MSIFDNCLVYLRTTNEEQSLGLSNEEIERHARRMAEVMIAARNGYMNAEMP